MRVGIITFHRAYNCGAMLQAWALRKVLERMGHTVDFPASNHVGETKRFLILEWCNPRKKGLQLIKSVLGRAVLNLCRIPAHIFSIPCADVLRSRYRKFRSSFLPESQCTIDNLYDNYDVIVYGSDQIWQPMIAGAELSVFLREEGDVRGRAIAYAASYGDKPLESNELSRVASALDRFDMISVRETLAKDQLSNVTHKRIEEVLDPTLLLTASDYDEIAKGEIPDTPYLFMYAVLTTPFIIKAAKELANRLDVKCVIAPCYAYTRWRSPRGITYAVSPDMLVKYAQNAKYVLACSFHGTVMGVLFNKPFLAFRASVDKYESRPAALLRKIGCSNRLVNPTTSIDEMERLLREPLPDYSAALDSYRTASLEWLRKAIDE